MKERITDVKLNSWITDVRRLRKKKTTGNRRNSNVEIVPNCQVEIVSGCEDGADGEDGEHREGVPHHGADGEHREVVPHLGVADGEHAEDGEDRESVVRPLVLGISGISNKNFKQNEEGASAPGKCQA